MVGESKALAVQQDRLIITRKGSLSDLSPTAWSELDAPASMHRCRRRCCREVVSRAGERIVPSRPSPDKHGQGQEHRETSTVPSQHVPAGHGSHARAQRLPPGHSLTCLSPQQHSIQTPARQGTQGNCIPRAARPSTPIPPRQEKVPQSPGTSAFSSLHSQSSGEVSRPPPSDEVYNLMPLSMPCRDTQGWLIPGSTKV